MKMKLWTMVMAVLAMGVLMAGPAIGQQPPADEDELASSSQLKIDVDHYFWANQQNTLGGYAYGLFLLDMNTGYSVLNGYIGAKIGDELAVYVLGATRSDPFFWHAGPSGWLGYDNDKFSFLAEYDYYFPQQKSSHLDAAPFPKDQYYSYL